MATITIENVPDAFINKYYKTTFSYNELDIKFKKDPTVKLQKMLENPDNTSYGPFSNVDDFLKHLHSNKD